MLLRNRSRAVTTKPTLMADHSSSQPSPNQSFKKTVPSYFGSQKFRDFIFTNKCLLGTEPLKSPTSILDTRTLSPLGNPFSYQSKIKTFPQKISSQNNSKGLALVGDLKDEKIDQNSCEPNKGNVLLRVKIPPFYSFEDKKCSKDSPNSVENVLSLSEMELSEEYTCVISHGPNPKTTHIFNNCIVESYFSLPQNSHFNSSNFLGFCFTCKKHLEHTKDIFIYRGEKAFCSRECRHREMVLDGLETTENEN